MQPALVLAWRKGGHSGERGGNVVKAVDPPMMVGIGLHWKKKV